jgi:hypothetical protein
MVRIEGQHVLQADFAIVQAVHHGAQPQPGQSVFLILLHDLHQQIAGALALT